VNPSPPSVQEWADARAAHLIRLLNAHQVDTRTFTGVDDAHGTLTVHHGRATLVDARLWIPAHGVDSVMQHAFAPSGSSTPHLVSDLAGLADGRWHFHVDLLPRVDVVRDTDYLDHVFRPLTAVHDQAYELPGSTPIPLPLRLRALASSWLVGVVGGSDDAAAFARVHDSYVARFIELLDHPPTVALSPAELRGRDAAHRAALFDAATDEVWEVLIDFVGADAVNEILSAVRTPRD
jgi:hypothetical protein